MYDISVLTCSDRNKPLLVNFVELVTRALELRGDNQRMVKYSVVALSQLFFEPKCRPEFDRCKDRILAVLDTVISTTKESDLQTYKSASVFKASLEDKPKPAVVAPASSGAGANKLRSVVSALRGAKTFASGSAAAAAKAADAAAPAAAAAAAKATDAAAPAAAAAPILQHVMISYEWSSQTSAKALNTYLQSAGLKTWFDLNDMGSNINDSMADAVENAYAIVVLFSRKYKESSNCRKECERGDELNKQMIFVKVEVDYKAEGWLGLVMGKTLWIDIHDGDAPQRIAKRVARAGAVAVKNVDSPQPLAAPLPPPVPIASDKIDQLHSMVTALVKSFAEMQADIKSLRADVNSIISNKQ